MAGAAVAATEVEVGVTEVEVVMGLAGVLEVSAGVRKHLQPAQLVVPRAGGLSGVSMAVPPAANATLPKRMIANE